MLKGKRILITGGAGFLGSYLSRDLDRKGCSVKVIDIRPRPTFFSKRIEYVQADVRNRKLTSKLFKNVDICYHLAAVFGGAQFIHDNQALILRSNLETFISVFEAASVNSIKRIVFPSSSLVYNEQITDPVHEGDLYKYPPTKNPYGFMKLVGENFCHYYWRERKLPFTIVRMFNVYGVGDEHDHVIPIFIKQVLSGQYPFKILGDGSETRVFTHIKDIVKGLVLIADSKKAENQEFNLSSEQEVLLIDLAKIIWRFLRRKEPFKATFTPLPSTTLKRRAVSASKIIEIFGWRPEIPLEEGLKEVVAWMKTSQK